ncbi:MAG: DUF1549 domain-containing protein, partial [Roseibacillus sp.]|nr:DUF1549 domain-containing protein [Roseibacillus sp.]
MIRQARSTLPSITGLAVVTTTLTAFPQDPGKPGEEGLNYFESHVRPIFATHCYECHSQKAKKLKASLYLDSKAGILKGGDSGAVIIPGKAAEALLIKAVRYQEEDLEMPPKKKLPDSAIEHLAVWINMGAPIPDDGARIADQDAAFDFGKSRREHWAFRPVVKPELPIVESREGTLSPIDTFVLARMQGRSVRSARRADRRTLIRRAHFTLIGLPPTPQEIETFLKDDDPEAFARMIDRLLESPHYGERWGRHWLDVARYSDGMGASQDSKPLPNAWRYRDWVVDAF